LYTDLIGQTWNIYAISALFGLRRDDVHFKLYSKKLREEIANILSRENVTYDAKFSLVEHIQPGSHHQNHPAIKVSLYSIYVKSCILCLLHTLFAVSFIKYFIEIYNYSFLEIMNA